MGRGCGFGQSVPVVEGKRTATPDHDDQRKSDGQKVIFKVVLFFPLKLAIVQRTVLTVHKVLVIVRI